MPRTSRNLVLLLTVFLSLVGSAFATPTLIGSTTITGGEQVSSGGVSDTGTVTATFNGVSVSVAYGQYSTPAAVASALAATISQKCSFPVYAHAVGAVINFYKKGTNAVNSATITSTSSNPSLFSSNSFLVGGGGDGIWSLPQIASLSLPEGPPGMGFTITGTGFTANTQVTVGGVTATIIGVPTSTQITVQVPSGVTIGGVAVIVNGWIATSPFTIDPPFQCNFSR
jgi:hypothetical protein